MWTILKNSLYKKEKTKKVLILKQTTSLCTALKNRRNKIKFLRASTQQVDSVCSSEQPQLYKKARNKTATSKNREKEKQKYKLTGRLPGKTIYIQCQKLRNSMLVSLKNYYSIDSKEFEVLSVFLFGLCVQHIIRDSSQLIILTRSLSFEINEGSSSKLGAPVKASFFFFFFISLLSRRNGCVIFVVFGSHSPGLSELRPA